jgi:phosphoserine phosphatase
MACRQVDEAGTAPKDGVMVCGDSGNDIELFAVPGVRGCMVVNAHPELRKWCDAHRSPALFQARTASLMAAGMLHLRNTALPPPPGVY